MSTKRGSSPQTSQWSVFDELKAAGNMDPLRREQLSRLVNLRQQLSIDRAIVFNTPELAGEHYRPDLPKVAIYGPRLTPSERDALIIEARTLKQELHIK